MADTIFFLRWQFTETGRFKHSMLEEIDFDQHLRRTGAADDRHLRWCQCPHCRADLYDKGQEP